MANRSKSSLQGLSGTRSVKIAVSETAMILWFNTVLEKWSALSDQTLEVVEADPSDTLDLMRKGQVIGAICYSKAPIHGFKSHTLGKICYRAVTSADFAEKYFREGIDAKTLAVAPSFRHANHDRLLFDWIDTLDAAKGSIEPRRLRSTDAILERCLDGEAWSLLPDALVEQPLASGTLIDLAPERPLYKTLYWHIASALAPHLRGLTDQIRSAARSATS